MTESDGPAVDPDVFRVEGHCCAIRLPGMATLSGEGSLYKLTPDARAQLVRDGVLPSEDTVASSPNKDALPGEK